MFGVWFNEEVTLRRAKSRDGRNKVVYEELLANGGPLRLKCKIDRRKRRVYTIQGVEKEVDATLFFRTVDAPELRLEDLVVTSSGEVFKAVGFDRQQLLGSGEEFGRVELRFTRTEVPADQHEKDVC